ncbi:MobC family plasmid mobilization relaxosome protein [bacterium]|nr:MobC family plasmid mobilization relaxosome protein [bacterium]
MDRKGGRPRLADDKKRSSAFLIKCKKSEHNMIRDSAKTHGLTVTEYVLRKSFGQKLTFNHVELLKELHQMNLELARTGNNINQLAKYANTMNKVGKLKPEIADKLHTSLSTYLQKQDEVRSAFRKLIREMSKP